MKKFVVRFQREFEVEVQATDTAAAEKWAQSFLANMPANTSKLLSIIQEGVAVETTEPEKPTPPFGRPNGGGTPGTPVVKQEVLADQIAKAA